MFSISKKLIFYWPQIYELKKGYFILKIRGLLGLPFRLLWELFLEIFAELLELKAKSSVAIITLYIKTFNIKTLHLLKKITDEKLRSILSSILPHNYSIYCNDLLYFFRSYWWFWVCTILSSLAWHNFIICNCIQTKKKWFFK